MKRIKKILCALIALMMLAAALPAAASIKVKGPGPDPENETSAVVDSGRCGFSAYWKLTEDMTLTVYGKGDADVLQILGWDFEDGDGDKGREGEGVYRTAIKKLVVEDGITALYNCCLEGSDSLESVIIADTVSQITNNDNGNNNYFFAKCSSLKDVKLMSALDYRGGDFSIYTFWKCSSLESVVMPAQIGKPGYLSGTFTGCTSLKSVWFPADYSTFNWMNYNPYEADHMPALTDVYYPGSRASFLKIDGANWFVNKAKLHTYCCWLPYCSFSTKYSTYAYTGKPITPKIKVVTPEGTTLKEGKNYTVSYLNNVEPGRGFVIVTGIGKYSGTRAFGFEIRPGRIKDIKVSDVYPNEATISWPEQPFADKYYVYIGNSLIRETTSTSVKLSLHSGKTRKVYVRSVIVMENEYGETMEYIGMADPVVVTTPGCGKAVLIGKTC